VSRKLSGFIQWGVLVAFVSPLLLTFCANPTDQPLRWKMNVQLPLTSNRNFQIGRMLDTMFFGGDTVKDTFIRKIDTLPGGVIDSLSDTTRDTSMILRHAYTDSGYTVIFSVVRHDSQTYTVKEDSLEDKTFDDNLGPIPLGSSSPFGVGFPYPLAAGVINNTLPIPLTGIYYLLFTVNSPTLNIVLRNKGTATLTGVSLGLVGADTVAGITLAPNASDTVHLAVAGRSVDSIPSFYIHANSYTGATVGPDSLKISFTLAGLTADSVNLIDSLINYSKTFTNNYKISDSVDMDFVDIKFGLFTYQIQNNSNMQLHLDAIHRDLWYTPYCADSGRNINSLATLSAFPNKDSVHDYVGQILGPTGTQIPPHTSTQFNSKANLSGCRLFPRWNVDSCVTTVDYIVHVAPMNKRIGISSADKEVFIISASNFQFDNFTGTLMKNYFRKGDTQFVAVSLPFPPGTSDSLRNNLILSKVVGNVNIRTGMPPGAMLDSFSLDFKVYDKLSGTSSSKTTTLPHVHNDTLYHPTMDLKNVINEFPDTVGVLANLTVPVGTRMHVVNDSRGGVSNEIGHMNIAAHVALVIDGYLNWSVQNTVNLHLGVGHTPVDSNSVKIFRKMTDKIGSIEMQVENHSNLYMRLFGILAPHSLIDSLDSMNLNVAYQYMVNPALAAAHGYVSLLDTGLVIPKRGQVLSNSVALGNTALDSILYSDTVGMRWMARFLVNSPDSLADTDYVRINSSIHIQGINSMDSLFSAFK
jgi:hypothetical protein